MKCLPRVIIVMSVLLTRVALAKPLDGRFTESIFSTGLSKITGMAWAPDGSERLFLATKDGAIRIVEEGTLLTEPFVVLEPVFKASECGLIGIAFNPSFASNGHVYAFVTVSKTEQQILRLTADGNQSVAQEVVISGLPTRGANHDGGAVGIGPDGKLYWAIGDNGNLSGTSSDLASLASKVGRANLDGSVPEDNPFVDGAGPNNDYVWATGMRNPFTFTWQPMTERLWVNVVGTVYEQVFVPSPGDNAGWNKYESNQPNGFLPPAIAYRTNLVDNRSITVDGASRVDGVATFTTPNPHRFRPGAKVTVKGVLDSSFDETDFIIDVPSPDRFSFAQSGPDANSGGGAITGMQLGGAITGGTFWDSSGAPQDLIGDYFFGDYVSGRVMRAEIGESTRVLSVDEWVTDLVNPIDAEVGPDGDLYFAMHSGGLLRLSYAAPSQNIVVSKLHTRTFEGATTAFNVRLALAPAAATTVYVARTAGDQDVEIASGHELGFDESNWAIPQRVLLYAAPDADLLDDEATLEVSSAGLASQIVRVRVIDNLAASIGGAAGSAGERDLAGANGDAGQTSNGAGGESAVGGAPSDEGGGGRDGTADGGATTERVGQRTDGCGCRTPRTAAASTEALIALVGLLLWRRQPGRAANRET
jgi:hypothetical protein